LLFVAFIANRAYYSRSQQQFVTDAPYRWIRHPIYLAFLLILGSTLLITSNWLIGALWLLATSIDVLDRIRYEERSMLAHFGDTYRAYIHRTGALLPRIQWAHHTDKRLFVETHLSD